MSKIAERIITLPKEVSFISETVKGGQSLRFSGPKGSSTLLFVPQEVRITATENKIATSSNGNVALTGTFNSLITNLVQGVCQGYQQTLEIKGVGYKVEMKDGRLAFSLGKSHLDYVNIPPELTVTVTGQKGLVVEGVDKQKVNNFSANIRFLRKPGAYHQKGVYYAGEKVKLKKMKSASVKK